MTSWNLRQKKSIRETLKIVLLLNMFFYQMNRMFFHWVSFFFFKWNWSYVTWGTLNIIFVTFWVALKNGLLCGYLKKVSYFFGVSTKCCVLFSVQIPLFSFFSFDFTIGEIQLEIFAWGLCGFAVQMTAAAPDIYWPTVGTPHATCQQLVFVSLIIKLTLTHVKEIRLSSIRRFLI